MQRSVPRRKDYYGDDFRKTFPYSVRCVFFTVFSQDSDQHRILEQISSRSLTFQFRR